MAKKKEKPLNVFIPEYRINKKRFDVFIPEHNLGIEYDGIQHFKDFKNGYFGNSKIKDIKRRDLEKNQYCKFNRIKLIRIPYTMIDSVENIIVREHTKDFPRSLNYSEKLLS